MMTEHEEARRLAAIEEDAYSFGHDELVSAYAKTRLALSKAEQELAEFKHFGGDETRMRREWQARALEAERERDEALWEVDALKGTVGNQRRELERLREAICAEAHHFPPDAVAGASCYCGKAAW